MSDTFVITEGNREDKIEIRWTERHIPEYLEKLTEKINGIRGVEKTYLHRYSLEIFFATHLLSQISCATYVVAVLETTLKTMDYFKDQDITVLH